jgi:hypothetical protein
MTPTRAATTPMRFSTCTFPARGLASEDEGFDAVIIHGHTTDSGLYGLRSRLSIPTVGPGVMSYYVSVRSDGVCERHHGR